MPIDIRQVSICTADGGEYPLVSATVMDDYQTMSGLMMTRGECVLTGSAPQAGAVISFTGVPRYLKVISVSASPMEGLYHVKFGCPLTIAQQAQQVDFTRRVEVDQQPVPEWWPDPSYIPQLTVNQLFAKCCHGMGLTAGSLGPFGEQPVFVIDNIDGEYEFTGTYASTAAAILSAAGQYGYYENDYLKSRPVLTPTAPGVVKIDVSNTLATGPGGGSGSPAGAYGVGYSTQGVKRWIREKKYPKETCSTAEVDVATRFVYYSFDTDVADPDNDPEDRSISYSYAPISTTCTYTDEDGQEYLVKETSTATGYLDNYAANLGTAGFTAGATSAANRSCTQVTETAREFDIAGHVIREVMEVTQESAVLGSSLNLPFARPEELLSDGTTVRPAELVYSLPGAAGKFVAERVERTTEVDFLDVKLTTRRWIAAGYTPEGQQAAAEAAKNTRNGARLGAILSSARRLIEQPEEVQRLTGAAQQWKAEIATAQAQKDAEDEAGVTDNTSVLYGVLPVTGYVYRQGSLGFADVNLSLPFIPSTDYVVAEVTEEDDGSLTTTYDKVAGTVELDALARNYAKAYNDLAIASLNSVNVQVPLSKAPSSVCRSYQAYFNGAAVSGVSTGATFQLTAEGGICSFDILTRGTIGSNDGSSWVGSVGAVPPLPPLVVDPDTGDLIYDETDVVLVPITQPLGLRTEGGIRLGVEAFSFAGPAVTTKAAEIGLALGGEADSSVYDPNVHIGLALGLRLGVLEDPAPATYTQSSVYSGTAAATFANMTDDSFTNTGTGTNTAATEFVRADLGSIRFITTVYVGTATDNIPGGWDKSYTENRDIEISDNGTDWTLVVNTGTFASEGIYPFTVNAPARYLRIKATSDYLAVSELRIAAI